MSHTRPIIAICGVPGSGKSSVAQRLGRQISATHVDMDHFQTFTEQNVHALAAQADHEQFYNQFQMPELADTLVKLKTGETDSLNSVTNKSGQKPIIFESHFGRAHDETGQYIDFMIWLDCPLDLALARKLHLFFNEFLQDDSSHHRQQIEWVNGYLQHYQDDVKALLDIQQQRVARDADIRIDSRQPLDQLVNTLETLIAQHV